MRRRTLIASVGAILGTSAGAAAYSQATVNRATTFTIATDSNGALLGLTDGTTNQIEIPTGGDALDVSLENLNTDSTFVFGNPASGSTVDLSTDYAFAITNNDTSPHQLTVSYGNALVKFDIFAPGGTSGSPDWTTATRTTTVNSGDVPSDGTIDNMASGAEYRVVMTVDTSGISSGSSTLDGTLAFTLSDPVTTA